MRVLVVDDHAEARETMRSMLQVLGHDVVEAGDPEAAVAAFGRHAVDVVVVDVVLPDRSGVELARALRAAAPACGVLLASGWNIDDAVVEAVEGAVFLRKPFGIGCLAEKLDELASARP
jgi:DNA-binding response OmpR family regulator